MSLLSANRAVLKSPDNIIQDGLVMEQLFTGGSLIDTKGSYDGTAFNLPALVNGINGGENNAYSFVSASSQYIDFGTISELEGVSKFSISVWVYKLSGVDFLIGKLANSVDTQNGVFIQWFSDNVMYFGVRNATGGSKNISGTSYLSQWVHIVMTYDGTNPVATSRLRVYLDSVDQGSGGGSMPATTDSQGFTFKICRYYGTNYGTGYADRLRIYNKVGDQDLIDALYAEKTV